MKIINNIFSSVFLFLIGYFLLFTILYLLKIDYYYLYSLISGACFLFAGLPFIIRTKHDDIYDNVTIFKTIFHLNYHKLARNELKKIKNLVMISLIIALMLLAKLIPIPSGFGTLGLSFSYLFFGIGALLYGPYAGIIIGFLVDSLEFLIFPSAYPYFFGYTLSSMLTGFIYGISFYKTRLTFSKVFICRIFVNLLINGILGTIWWGIINSFTTFEQYFIYFISISLVKNLVYLIPQSVLLFILIKALMPVFLRSRMIDEKIASHVTLF